MEAQVDSDSSLARSVLFLSNPLMQVGQETYCENNYMKVYMNQYCFYSCRVSLLCEVISCVHKYLAKSVFAFLLWFPDHVLLRECESGTELLVSGCFIENAFGFD